MRVFITGGSGFIGSHLCDALVARGDKVTILDNLSTGAKKNIMHLDNKINLVQGDIRNKELVESMVEKSDLILHMAAALGVENILNEPIESISVNYHGSEIVLNAAVRFDKRIVIASTSEVYGKNPNQPLKENFDRVIGPPQKLRWTYSDSKALEEAMAYALFITKKLKVTTIRLFNTVGPRQTGKYGMVIPKFVEAAIANQPLIVHGDGSQSRVFCHVSDATRAILTLTDCADSIGEVYNIGGLEEVSILSLANLIIKITNSNSKIIFKKYEDAFTHGFEDMEKRIPDIEKIKKLTGWTPKFSLHNIIEDIIKSLT
jgi:UDP-glucose 4-epimerase